MFSSDATHLTTFGTAKAWPIYLMLGNLSKYIRAQPHSGAMHHLAYIPSVSHFLKTEFIWLTKSLHDSCQILFKILIPIFIADGEVKKGIF